MEQELRALGLTDIETKIYLTLLEIGPSHAGFITQKSGVHRRMVYDAIERLIKKGLVGYIVRNNRKLFSAVDPKRLVEIAEEKKVAVESILPQLSLTFASAKEKKETLFYEGKAGVKTVFEDQLKDGKELLIIGSSPIGIDLFKFYFIWFDKRRVRKKMKTKILLSEKLRGKFLQKIPLSALRYLPDVHMGSTSTNIWGDKVAIIHWDRKKPFAIVITQPEIADSYRRLYNLLWYQAKK